MCIHVLFIFKKETHQAHKCQCSRVFRQVHMKTDFQGLLKYWQKRHLHNLERTL